MSGPWKIADLGPAPDGRYRAEHLAVRGIVALQALGILPAGTPESVEGGSQDTRAGFDWLITNPDGTSHALGMHVGLTGDKGTFSLRYRTARGNLSELTKRARSIAAGGAYPTYTVHVYGDKVTGIIEQAYTVCTADLWRHVVVLKTDDPERFTLCSCAKLMRNPDGSEFVAVAVTERARARLGLKAALGGHGVVVHLLRPATIGVGLGL